MLEVTVNINREKILAQVHAVRIKPKTKDIKPGTICTYDIIFNNVRVDGIKGAYGCGIELAKQMLEQYDKQRYMLIYLSKTEDKRKDEKNKL